MVNKKKVAVVEKRSSLKITDLCVANFVFCVIVLLLIYLLIFGGVNLNRPV